MYLCVLYSFRIPLVYWIESIISADDGSKCVGLSIPGSYRYVSCVLYRIYQEYRKVVGSITKMETIHNTATMNIYSFIHNTHNIHNEYLIIHIFIRLYSHTIT